MLKATTAILALGQMVSAYETAIATPDELITRLPAEVIPGLEAYNVTHHLD